MNWLVTPAATSPSWFRAGSKTSSRNFRVPPSSPPDIEALLEALGRVRRQGWEEASDEAIPGVGSVAASVTDPENGETLGFCLSFPDSSVPKSDRERIAALVTAAARRIASRFGDSFFSQFIRVVPESGAIAA